jgi:Family of unknown function (DUF5302)
MSEENSKNVSNDVKAKMLEAITRKQRGHNIGNKSGPLAGSKIGAGQTGGVAPKIHRRKAGSA